MVLRVGASRIQLQNGMHMTMLHDGAADTRLRLSVDVTGESYKN